MKTLLLTLLPMLMLLTTSASAADLYKIETKVLELPQGFQAGVYSDKEIKELFKDSVSLKSLK